MGPSIVFRARIVYNFSDAIRQRESADSLIDAPRYANANIHVAYSARTFFVMSADARFVTLTCTIHVIHRSRYV